MDELKPCPFCGGTDLVVKRRSDLDGMTFIICESCGVVTSFHGNELHLAAMAAWNRREGESDE